MIRPCTLCPRLFRPHKIRPCTVYPYFFTSPYVSSLTETDCQHCISKGKGCAFKLLFLDFFCEKKDQKRFVKLKEL
jgi:hypothetical protein